MMSDIRKEFYEAINKANVQKPKKSAPKNIVQEKASIEIQIQNIINESELAIVNDKVTVNNQPLIDWLYSVTKRDKKTLELEERVNQELEILNKLREEARKKYLQMNRMNEKVGITPTSAASSSAGGTLRVSIDPSTNSYVVDDYVDNYIV